MSEDIVKIKGMKAGLQLSFSKDAKFPAIKSNILGKLNSGNSFFIRGTTVYIQKDTLPNEQIEVLKKIFHQNGMLFSTEMPKLKPKIEPKKLPPEEDVQQMIVINRTVRGGQEIKTKSSVLICGNVNPGAQIIAGGSIDIRGTCRGIVHAGAFGNANAFIVADQLMPLQIRIADLVARSPDVMEKAESPERASIKDGQIVIEPIAR
ncbi:MAG: septum site-determining protein MinC [Selenomonadaceae bacterium]|nr:septum site-determining protein MinC [Selenomonadaceae bacterium]MBR1860144.1 septum site-determining protein MinC [Selenomonadaceae bacterium]